MYEIRDYNAAPTAKMEQVDHVVVPAKMLREAEEKADQTRKTHFVGIIFEPNPNFVEEPVTGNFAEAIFKAFTPLPAIHCRIRPSGYYVISDDYTKVREKCGEIVWVPPTRNNKDKIVVQGIILDVPPFTEPRIIQFEEDDAVAPQGGRA